MTEQAPQYSTAFDERLLELLVCPKSHGPLTYDAESQTLISAAANLSFPIRDGVPILLVEQATPINGPAQ